MEHEHLRTKEKSKAETYLRKAGYKVGGRVSDKEQDAKMIASGVHQHERNMHKGEKPTALTLKGGGKVGGKESKSRLDKYARGGRTKGGPSKINIVIATGKDQQQPQAVPVPVPRPVPVPAAAGGPQGMPPGGMPPGAMPPGGMPPGAGMPPGGAPQMPMRPPMKRGGAVGETKGDAGAGGAMGRLEKAGMEDRIKGRRYASGGSVDNPKDRLGQSRQPQGQFYGLGGNGSGDGADIHKEMNTGGDNAPYQEDMNRTPGYSRGGKASDRIKVKSHTRRKAGGRV